MSESHSFSKHRLAELFRFAQDRAADRSQPYADLQAYRDLEALAGGALGAAATSSASLSDQTPSLGSDEILVAITRGEGYLDVHNELVAADAFASSTFQWRVID